MTALLPETAPYPWPVTVAIEGISEPTTHPTLLDGLAALWRSASREVIWGPCFNATQEVLSPVWAPNIAAILERDGRWEANLVLRGDRPGELLEPKMTIRSGAEAAQC